MRAKEDIMATAIRNKAGNTFMKAMKRIDHIHREIDKRARAGKHNEDDTYKFKIASNGARVWSF
jgi:hypothetical protein